MRNNILFRTCVAFRDGRQVIEHRIAVITQDQFHNSYNHFKNGIREKYPTANEYQFRAYRSCAYDYENVDDNREVA